LSGCNPAPSPTAEPIPSGDTPASFDDTTPRFSPDGERIVFVRDRGDDSDIYVMNLEGGRSRLLVDASRFDLDPAFSPEGTQVLFAGSPNGYAQLHVVPVVGGDIEPISEVPDGWATYPAWSPDGSTIV
jgi:TolB protein